VTASPSTVSPNLAPTGEETHGAEDGGQSLARPPSSPPVLDAEKSITATSAQTEPGDDSGAHSGAGPSVEATLGEVEGQAAGADSLAENAESSSAPAAQVNIHPETIEPAVPIEIAQTDENKEVVGLAADAAVDSASGDVCGAGAGASVALLDSGDGGGGGGGVCRSEADTDDVDSGLGETRDEEESVIGDAAAPQDASETGTGAGADGSGEELANSEVPTAQVEEQLWLPPVPVSEADQRVIAMVQSHSWFMPPSCALGSFPTAAEKHVESLTLCGSGKNSVVQVGAVEQTEHLPNMPIPAAFVVALHRAGSSSLSRSEWNAQFFAAQQQILADAPDV